MISPRLVGRRNSKHSKQVVSSGFPAIGSSQVIFHATTEVWHRWLRDTGPIGGLIERVIRNQGDASSVPAIREELDRLLDRAYVDRQLQKTDEELRKIGAKRRPISDRSITAVYATDVRRRLPSLVSGSAFWKAGRNRDNWIAERVREYRRDLLTSVPLDRQFAFGYT